MTREAGDRRHAPPLAAELLLRALLPAEEREYVLGDLEEHYRLHLAPERGFCAARRWYWIQTFNLVGLRWTRPRLERETADRRETAR